MFLVSDAAGERLLDMLRGVRPKAGQSLRLTQRTPERVGLALDWEREGDQVVLCSDRVVLLIEPDLADLLAGTTLVVERGLEGQRLGLRASPAAAKGAAP